MEKHPFVLPRAVTSRAVDARAAGARDCLTRR
jgi:hypothetical protein